LLEPKLLRAIAAGELMSSIDIDLDTYCGRVANLYIRRQLSPPFALRRVATEWKALGIALTHTVSIIERHLTDYRTRYYSGSGDALFGWIDEIIRKTWREQHQSRSQDRGPAMQRIAAREWGGRQPSANLEIDARHNPTFRVALVSDRSGAPGCRADEALPQSAKSVGQKGKGPKRIDQAVAFLRRELADDEVAATLLEEKAMASGISLRTLDRARARLKVISRRTGFAKEGKCWCSLPRTP
jgi:hypothetical protein